MQEVDEPVHKVGNFVKNQGKQECKLCVAVKKKKKSCVLAKDETMGEKTGGWQLFCVSLVEESYLAVSLEKGYLT